MVGAAQQGLGGPERLCCSPGAPRPPQPRPRPCGVTSAGKAAAPAGRAQGSSDCTEVPPGVPGREGDRVMEEEAVDGGAALGQGRPHRKPRCPPPVDAQAREWGVGNSLATVSVSSPADQGVSRVEATWKGRPLPTCDLSPGRARPPHAPASPRAVAVCFSRSLTLKRRAGVRSHVSGPWEPPSSSDWKGTEEAGGWQPPGARAPAQ